MDRMNYICHSTEEICFAVDPMLNKFFFDYGHHTISGAEFFGDRVDKLGWLAKWDKAFEES